MATGMTVAQLAGLIASTQDTLIDGLGWEPTFLYNDYPLLDLFINNNMKMRGKNLRRDIRTGAGANAGARNTYESRARGVTDNSANLDVEYVQYDTAVVYDEYEQIANDSEQAVFDLVMQRTEGEMEGMQNLLEDNIINPPPQDSDSQGKHYWGITSWIVPGGTGSFSGDFVGQTLQYNDTGTATSWAGFDRSANVRLRNWAASWDGKVNAKLIRLMKEAMLNIGVAKSPLVDPRNIRGSRKVWLANTRVYLELQEMADNRSSNNGAMLTLLEGNPMVMGVPVLQVPVLDKTSSTDTHRIRSIEPLIYMNLDHWEFIACRGYWNVKRPIKVEEYVVTQVWPFWSQIICKNPRHGGAMIHLEHSVS